MKAKNLIQLCESTEVIVREKVVTQKEEVCPHCQQVIQEKSIFYDQNGKYGPEKSWYHRPCMEKGPIAFPKDPEAEKVGEVLADKVLNLLQVEHYRPKDCKKDDPRPECHTWGWGGWLGLGGVGKGKGHHGGHGHGGHGGHGGGGHGGGGK